MKLSVLNKRSSKSSGFTLIELLVVIAVIGILAAATLIAVDPIDRINAANDSRVQQAISAIANAEETYAVSHDGYYTTGGAAAITALTGSGDLKNAPVNPTGYTGYAVVAGPGGCTAGPAWTCTQVVVTNQLKSKKYSATPIWRYESATGKSCAVAAPGNGLANLCP